jgi:hypothetical protein
LAYIFLNSDGQRPTSELAAIAGVPYMTAAQWINRARERGFIEPTGRPRKGSAKKAAAVKSTASTVSVEELEQITGMWHRPTESSEGSGKVIRVAKKSRKAKPPAKKAAARKTAAKKAAARKTAAKKAAATRTTTTTGKVTQQNLKGGK